MLCLVHNSKANVVTVVKLVIKPHSARRVKLTMSEVTETCMVQIMEHIALGLGETEFSEQDCLFVSVVKSLMHVTMKRLIHS
jgi:hypothetical protein